jgi:hypothetical protein
MSEIEVKYKGDLQRLRLEPGDKLVLRINTVLSIDQYHVIMNTMRKFIGRDDVEILMLEPGMSLEIINTKGAT